MIIDFVCKGASHKPISKDVIIDLGLLEDNVLRLDDHCFVGLDGESFCADLLAGDLGLVLDLVVLGDTRLESGSRGKLKRSGLGRKRTWTSMV